MESKNLSPTVNFSDSFALCLHLLNLCGLYDKFQIHIYHDETHVTFLTCNHLELVSRLTYLDYSKCHDVYVFGSTKGIDKSNDFTQLFAIFQRYRNTDNREQMIKLYYF